MATASLLRAAAVWGWAAAAPALGPRPVRIPLAGARVRATRPAAALAAGPGTAGFRPGSIAERRKAAPQGTGSAPARVRPDSGCWAVRGSRG